jgi:hypothetical protein
MRVAVIQASRLNVFYCSIHCVAVNRVDDIM